MVIIVPNTWSIETINELFHEGMSAIVVDERSDLVNKTYVD